MKTKLLRTLVLPIVLCIVSCFSLQAQWVSIPDTNFGTWLDTSGYSACMQGNNQMGWQMDTSCPAVVGETRVVCVGKNIYNLTGIQYFDSLDYLSCGNNQLTSLPTLPESLYLLNCDKNKLTSLPTLPGSLTWFMCRYNQLTSLPTIPASLTYLGVHHNELTSLPTLPGNLIELDCTNNQLTLLPTLPGSLFQLNCSNNQLTLLPSLPGSLNNLQCSFNQLTSLPTLPGSLTWFMCRYNQLTSLPALPASLIGLVCDSNQLTSLPTLPGNLTDLTCRNNQLTLLPTLPGSLLNVSCDNNQLTSLPTLPGSLLSLRCSDNQLTSLTILPGTLTTLECSFNQLTLLPTLPRSIGNLQCSYNQLTSIPELPDLLSFFYCNNNPQLYCLPQLKKIKYFQFDNTGITCLPNYPQQTVSSSPPLNTVPACDILNGNGCPVFWNLAGNVYEDANLNCINDNSEAGAKHIKVQLRSNGTLVQEMITFGGLYSFPTDTFGNYELSIDTIALPFIVSCPANNTLYDTITALDSMHYDRDFALGCNPGFDLAAWSILGGRFRPANFTNVNISTGDITNFYGLHCAAGVSGAVTITMSGFVTYISPASGALTPSVSGNVLTYSIADFGAMNFNADFNIIIQTDTNAVLGSQVCFTVEVTPIVGDNNPANNTLTQCFTVVGSFDPNDKQVYPVSDVDVNGEQWLTYTVNFQNTGTDTAYHIYITDTLDADLDASTFQLLAYSHQPMVQIKESAVRFNFPNIMLVDSHANEPLSHGYVQYKIKIKDNKPVGTVINNTAFIYFDFNAPVVTNTTSNTIALINSVGEVRYQISDIRIYPNPASNSVTISVDESMLGATATITDITGRSMAAVQLSTVNLQLSTESLAGGVYFVTVSNEKGSVTKKLVKE
ncbi:MAG: T9SS type A sorting domain-containing protein [Bacteroidota bacterium]